MSPWQILPLLLGLTLARAQPAASPADMFDAGRDDDIQPAGELDTLVFDQLRDMGIQPANPCSDAVFLRRVHLDAIGTLPTAEETRAFLSDKTPGRRRALVDRLLERDEYADYWAMKWSDLLRVKAEFPINLWPHAAQMYHRWIRGCIRDNVPWDRVAREILTSNGSNFRVPPVNFYRAMQNRQPQGIAQTVALTFMGARAEKWPADRLAGLAALFSRLTYKPTAEWKEEIVFFDPAPADPAPGAHTAPPGEALFPDGIRRPVAPGCDPRAAFTDWLLAQGNPWFARDIANRVWSWVMGRGIIHEPDDIRPDNPPSNAALLAWLERRMIASSYDIKGVLRLILNSRVYQLSPIARSAHPAADTHFARYPLRRLEAEVLIDALCRITGTTEKYVSLIPEPFTFIPEHLRSIALPDGSITSSFLELFGRPARDTGLESERNNRPTPAQRLHLLNSSHIRRKLEQSPTLQTLFQSAKGQEEMVTNLYLAILSRLPSQDELGICTASRKGKSRDALLDTAWALLNSPEFLCRH